MAHERVISNQELNSLEDFRNSGRDEVAVVIPSGNGRNILLSSQSKTLKELPSFSADELESLEGNEQVELTKGADAFPVTPSYPARPQGGRMPGSTSKPLRAPSGFGRYAARPRPVNQGLHGGPGGGPNGNPDDENNKNLLDLNTQKSDQDVSQCKDPSLYKKKRRNSHLDRKVEVNGHDFNIPRAQVEKKVACHGVDLGLEPEIGKDGKPILDKKFKKPMAKNTKKNHELFTDKLEEFMRKYEMREGYFRKGRNNGCEAFIFYDAANDRVASFRKDNGDLISFWTMDKDQKIEFLKNNNVI